MQRGNRTDEKVIEVKPFAARDGEYVIHAISKKLVPKAKPRVRGKAHGRTKQKI